MRIICTECGSALVERRDRQTGLPYPACERDASHGRPVVVRVGHREHRPSKGRWWRAARRALGTLTG
jgi:hypothetical protein